jgi:AraC-like DNA-binding protein
LERLDGKPYLEADNLYYHIGLIYYDFKLYDKAIPLFWKVLEYPRTYYFNNRAQMKARDYLGDYYRMIGDYNRSNSLYLSILQSTDRVFLRPIDETVAIGGLAKNAMLRGDDAEATRLYSVALQRALLVKDSTLAGGYAVQLGRLYMQENKLQKTEEFLHAARKYLIAGALPIRNWNMFYTFARDYYLKTDQSDKAAAYIDSIALIQKLEEEKYNTGLLAYSEQEAYELEKMLKDEKIKSQKNRLVLISVILVLTIATLIIFIYSYRIKKKKNRALYRQIKEQDRLLEELNKLSTIRVENFRLQPENGNTKQHQLVSKLHDYLLRDRNFTQFDIDHNQLASELATNKTFLFEAIKAITEKTPQEYINDLRLDEAKKMFDNHSNYTIEAIAFECGFNSYRTFYRLFKKRYQLSPAEYCKLAKS